MSLYIQSFRFVIVSLCFFVLSGCAGLRDNQESIRDQHVLQLLDSDIHQALIVHSVTAFSKAQVTAWEKKDMQWQVKFDAMSAVLGRNGLAPLGVKQEGDGRTPSGIYQIRRAFGYEPNVQTKLDYQQVTDRDIWVDDPESPQYNQWIQSPTEAKSFERLKRDDNLYKYGIVIEYNTDLIIPGNGSAIFIHIWRGDDKPTAGCVALAEDDVKKLLAWFSLSLHPVIILGDLTRDRLY